MILSKSNIVKIALDLENKQTLTKNEKVLLKFFSMFKYIVDNIKNLNLNTICLKDAKHLKLIKHKIKIKKFIAKKYTIFSPNFNLFYGDINSVLISKTGYIKIYNNRVCKNLNLYINGKNIFENSQVINYANKTVFLNKNFLLKFKMENKKLIINSTKKIDNFNSKFYSLVLNNKLNFLLSNIGLKDVNILLSNLCKISNLPLKRNLNALNNQIDVVCEVFDYKTYQKYVNLLMLNFCVDIFEFKVNVVPLYLNNFLGSIIKLSPNAIMVRDIKIKTNFIKHNIFKINFINNIFYLSSVLNFATFKISLLMGEYKIIKTNNFLKVVNITLNKQFVITFFCKLESYKILNFELVLFLSGDIKFAIGLFTANKFMEKIYNNYTLIKLENVFSSNIVKTLDCINSSFYNLNKIDKVFFDKLRIIVKNKQSLRYAANS